MQPQTLSLKQPATRKRRSTEYEAPKLALLNAPKAGGEASSNTSGSTSVCCFPMKRSLSDTDDTDMLAKIQAARQKMWGSMILYFGCRRADLDYIYKDELMRAKVEGALTDVHVAFSRDPKRQKVCVYVCSPHPD